ncbi:hypothetical protein BC830DRAFT_481555 [Chytriomyces sp. MP71]|nr:hypothetical protein BC830DRAFT_481555 [Chytriomyces sp. MP71]
MYEARSRDLERLRVLEDEREAVTIRLATVEVEKRNMMITLDALVKSNAKHSSQGNENISEEPQIAHWCKNCAHLMTLNEEDHANEIAKIRELKALLRKSEASVAELRDANAHTTRYLSEEREAHLDTLTKRAQLESTISELEAQNKQSVLNMKTYMKYSEDQQKLLISQLQRLQTFANRRVEDVVNVLTKTQGELFKTLHAVKDLSSILWLNEAGGTSPTPSKSIVSLPKSLQKIEQKIDSIADSMHNIMTALVTSMNTEAYEQVWGVAGTHPQLMKRHVASLSQFTKRHTDMRASTSSFLFETGSMSGVGQDIMKRIGSSLGFSDEGTEKLNKPNTSMESISEVEGEEVALVAKRDANDATALLEKHTSLRRRNLVTSLSTLFHGLVSSETPDSEALEEYYRSLGDEKARKMLKIIEEKDSDVIRLVEEVDTLRDVLKQIEAASRFDVPNIPKIESPETTVSILKLDTNVLLAEKAAMTTRIAFLEAQLNSFQAESLKYRDELNAKIIETESVEFALTERNAHIHDLEARLQDAEKCQKSAAFEVDHVKRQMQAALKKIEVKAIEIVNFQLHTELAQTESHQDVVANVMNSIESLTQGWNAMEATPLISHTALKSTIRAENHEIAVLKIQIETLSERLKDKTLRISDLEAAIVQHTTDFEKARDRDVRQLKEKTERLKALESEFARLQANLSSTHPFLTKMQDLEEAVQHLKAALARKALDSDSIIENLKSDVSTLVRKLKIQNDEMEDLKFAMKDAQTIKKGNESTISDLKVHLNSAKLSLRSLEVIVKDKESKIQQLEDTAKEARSNCQNANTDVEKSRQELLEVQKKAALIQKLSSEKDGKTTELVNELHACKTLLSSNNLRLSDSAAIIKSLQSSISSAERERDLLQNELHSARVELAKLQETTTSVRVDLVEKESETDEQSCALAEHRLLKASAEASATNRNSHLHKLKESLEKLIREKSELSERLTQALAEVISYQQKNVDLQQQYSARELSMGHLNQQLSKANGKVTSLEGFVSTQKASISEKDIKIRLLEDAVVALKSELSVAASSLDKEIAQIESLSQLSLLDKELLREKEAVMHSLSDRIQFYISTVGSLEEVVSEKDIKIEELCSSLQSQKNAQQMMSRDLALKVSEIDSLKSHLDSNLQLADERQATIDKLESNSVQHKLIISNLESEWKKRETKVDKLEKQIEFLKSDVDMNVESANTISNLQALMDANAAKYRPSNLVLDPDVNLMRGSDVEAPDLNAANELTDLKGAHKLKALESGIKKLVHENEELNRTVNDLKERELQSYAALQSRISENELLETLTAQQTDELSALQESYRSLKEILNIKDQQLASQAELMHVKDLSVQEAATSSGIVDKLAALEREYDSLQVQFVTKFNQGTTLEGQLQAARLQVPTVEVVEKPLESLNFKRRLIDLGEEIEKLNSQLGAKYWEMSLIAAENTKVLSETKHSNQTARPAHLLQLENLKLRLDSLKAQYDGTTQVLAEKQLELELVKSEAHRMNSINAEFAHINQLPNLLRKSSSLNDIDQGNAKAIEKVKMEIDEAEANNAKLPLELFSSLEEQDRITAESNKLRCKCQLLQGKLAVSAVNERSDNMNGSIIESRDDSFLTAKIAELSQTPAFQSNKLTSSELTRTQFEASLSSMQDQNRILLADIESKQLLISQLQTQYFARERDLEASLSDMQRNNSDLAVEFKKVQLDFQSTSIRSDLVQKLLSEAEQDLVSARSRATELGQQNDSLERELVNIRGKCSLLKSQLVFMTQQNTLELEPQPADLSETMEVRNPEILKNIIGELLVGNGSERIATEASTRNHFSIHELETEFCPEETNFRLLELEADLKKANEASLSLLDQKMQELTECKETNARLHLSIFKLSATIDSLQSEISSRVSESDGLKSEIHRLSNAPLELDALKAKYVHSQTSLEAKDAEPQQALAQIGENNVELQNVAHPAGNKSASEIAGLDLQHELKRIQEELKFVVQKKVQMEKSVVSKTRELNESHAKCTKLAGELSSAVGFHEQLERFISETVAKLDAGTNVGNVISEAVSNYAPLGNVLSALRQNLIQEYGMNATEFKEFQDSMKLILKTEFSVATVVGEIMSLKNESSRLNTASSVSKIRTSKLKEKMLKSEAEVARERRRADHMQSTLDNYKTESAILIADLKTTSQQLEDQLNHERKQYSTVKEKSETPSVIKMSASIQTELVSLTSNLVGNNRATQTDGSATAQSTEQSDSSTDLRDTPVSLKAFENAILVDLIAELTEARSRITLLEEEKGSLSNAVQSRAKEASNIMKRLEAEQAFKDMALSESQSLRLKLVELSSMKDAELDRRYGLDTISSLLGYFQVVLEAQNSLSTYMETKLLAASVEANDIKSESSKNSILRQEIERLHAACDNWQQSYNELRLTAGDQTESIFSDLKQTKCLLAQAQKDVELLRESNTLLLENLDSLKESDQFHKAKCAELTVIIADQQARNEALAHEIALRNRERDDLAEQRQDLDTRLTQLSAEWEESFIQLRALTNKEKDQLRSEHTTALTRLEERLSKTFLSDENHVAEVTSLRNANNSFKLRIKSLDQQLTDLQAKHDASTLSRREALDKEKTALKIERKKADSLHTIISSERAKNAMQSRQIEEYALRVEAFSSSLDTVTTVHQAVQKQLADAHARNQALESELSLTKSQMEHRAKQYADSETYFCKQLSDARAEFHSRDMDWISRMSKLEEHLQRKEASAQQPSFSANQSSLQNQQQRNREVALQQENAELTTQLTSLRDTLALQTRDLTTLQILHKDIQSRCMRLTQEAHEQVAAMQSALETARLDAAQDRDAYACEAREFRDRIAAFAVVEVQLRRGAALLEAEVKTGEMERAQERHGAEETMAAVREVHGARVTYLEECLDMAWREGNAREEALRERDRLLAERVKELEDALDVAERDADALRKDVSELEIQVTEAIMQKQGVEGKLSQAIHIVAVERGKLDQLSAENRDLRYRLSAEQEHMQALERETGVILHASSRRNAALQSQLHSSIESLQSDAESLLVYSAPLKHNTISVGTQTHPSLATRSSMTTCDLVLGWKPSPTISLSDFAVPSSDRFGSTPTMPQHGRVGKSVTFSAAVLLPRSNQQQQHQAPYGSYTEEYEREIRTTTYYAEEEIEEVEEEGEEDMEQRVNREIAEMRQLHETAQTRTKEAINNFMNYQPEKADPDLEFIRSATKRSVMGTAAQIQEMMEHQRS